MSQYSLPAVPLSPVPLSPCPPVPLFVYLSICLSVYLSICLTALLKGKKVAFQWLFTKTCLQSTTPPTVSLRVWKIHVYNSCFGFKRIKTTVLFCRVFNWSLDTQKILRPPSRLRKDKVKKSPAVSTERRILKYWVLTGHETESDLPDPPCPSVSSLSAELSGHRHRSVSSCWPLTTL